MPTGKEGRTIEMCVCPICNEKFTRNLGIRNQTCSPKCGLELQKINHRKHHSNWSINRVREEKLRIIEEEKKERQSHILTVLHDMDGEGEVI